MRKLGIIVADKDEFLELEEKIKSGEYKEASFLNRPFFEFKIGEDICYALLCGIGKVNAAVAAMHLVDIGCEMIFNYGLSGGISKVSRGDLCICTSFLEHDFDLTGIGYKPCEKPGQDKFVYSADEKLCNIARSIIPNFREGLAATGDRFVSDSALRNLLRDEFGAICCDMETAAIAYVCDYSSVPFLSLRRISDDAGNDAVEEYREMNLSKETILSDLIFDIIGNLER